MGLFISSTCKHLRIKIVNTAEIVITYDVLLTDSDATYFKYNDETKIS